MQQGKIDGTVKTYFRNGKIETEKEYRQSVESGRERRFDSKTGEQIFESHYIDGKKEGEEWEIFEDGRTLRSRTTRHYRTENLTALIVWNHTGRQTLYNHRGTIHRRREVGTLETVQRHR